MTRPLPVLLRSAAYALRGGFLIRPLAIAIVLGVVGALISELEEAFPGLGDLLPGFLFPSRKDPQVAQAILSVIATSIMTLVSIVYAILLMTLTLASTQFSPRILIGFVRDRSTQWTLGLFLGTFSYCVAGMPAARAVPVVFVPIVTVTGAMLLALACTAWLIFFIHHISRSISVNHIVDRIARETELVIDDYMPHQRGGPERAEAAPPRHGEVETPIVSTQAGYIRYLDIDRLVALARDADACIRVERRVGDFVPTGVPILWVTNAERITPEHRARLLAALDIGPVRTLQQDVEFGVIQIVDIALKAISPAVNDPTTAISCIDQLSRILIRWFRQAPPRRCFHAPANVPRLIVPWITMPALLDTAFEQIRHYARGDGAVSLRLVRALDDVAATVADGQTRAVLLERARGVVAGCAGTVSDGDLVKLRQRLAGFEARLGAGPDGPD